MHGYAERRGFREREEEGVVLRETKSGLIRHSEVSQAFTRYFDEWPQNANQYHATDKPSQNVSFFSKINFMKKKEISK